MARDAAGDEASCDSSVMLLFPERSPAGDAHVRADAAQDSEGFEIVTEEEFDALEQPEPESPVALSERLAAVLAASAHAQTNLRALFRTVKFLGASVGTARETNEHLILELTSLYNALANTNSDEVTSAAALGADLRAAALERALDHTKQQAVCERQFLIDEQDAFIARLVTDHERELKRLRRRVAEAEARLAAREAADFSTGWDE